MKLPLSLRRLVYAGIEPLEARVAPATLYVGVIPTSEDTKYSDAPFVKMETATDAISNAVGHAPGTFYVEIGAGKAFNRIDVPGPDGAFREFLTVKSGTIVAFFRDANGDNEVQSYELMGLALGPKVSLAVKEAIGADVVSNFDVANDTLTLNTVSADHGIVELSADRIDGKILSGGSISKATFDNAIGAYAGSGTAGQSYGFFPGNPLATLSAASPAATAGASISNLTATQIVEIRAGDGGAGAAGGSISNIQLLGDGDGLTMVAGGGGAADPGMGKLKGGPGGKLQNIYIAGDDAGASLISLQAGKGGNAPAGIAGAGGAASSIFIGFSKSGARAVVPSALAIHDQVFLAAGPGGNGKVAGAGGAASVIRIDVATDNGPGDDIVVGGGTGGSSSGVIAGRGGSVSNVEALNRALQDNTLNAVNAQIVVYGGPGGLASSNALGAAGGSITGLKLLGSGLSVLGGAGSNGITGGDGGSLIDVQILQASGVFARDGVFNAGFGGNGTTGHAGRGGNIAGLKTGGSADFASLIINDGLAANGGDSASGAGGLGGSVIGLEIHDIDSRNNRAGLPPLTGILVVRTGVGGDGAIAQPGGSLLNATIFTADLGQTIITGGGGKNLGSGNGGAGGLASGLNIVAAGTTDAARGAVQIFSGRGGDGGTAPGNHSSGGAGGSIARASVDSTSVVALLAGGGGNGGGGAAGGGGSVLGASVLAGRGENPSDMIADSAAIVLGGDAGLLGTQPGAGGGIAGAKTPSQIFATGNLTIQAGDGSKGGRGGSITNIVFGASGAGLVPNGSILVQAGNGSADAADHFTGPGGSVSFITGPVTGGASLTTVFRAGDGGGSPNHSSAGGSISHVSITGGARGAVFQADSSVFQAGKLIVEAGDAGNAGLPASSVNQAKGANGGSVSDFTMKGVNSNTILQSLAGGDGAPGRLVGGTGGSVRQVQVAGHDIGLKTGQSYGYSTMGGIFAGVGGDGGTRDGLAGDVQFIRADSISAIVAGKGSVPALVEQVDHVVLNPALVDHVVLNAGPTLTVEIPGGPDTQSALIFHPIVQTETVVDGNTSTQESQLITRLLGGFNSAAQPPGGPTTFQLTFNGQTTVALDANADVATIRDALNDLSSIQSVGGVTLTDNAANPNALDKGGQTFTVTFNIPGNQGSIVGAGLERTALFLGHLPATAAKVLNQLPNIDDHIANNGQFSGVDVASTAGGGFQVTFRGPGNQGPITGERVFDIEATGVPPVAIGFFSKDQNFDVLGVGEFVLNVDVGFGPESTIRLPANATTNQVAAAINNLNGVQAVGETASVSVGPNSSYNIHFLTGETIITGQEFSSLLSATVLQGTPQLPESVTLDFVPLIRFDRVDFLDAHLVGAIADFNELNANHFKFIDANANGTYDLGETPIDGLIAAKRLSLKAPTNFIPEARFALQIQRNGPFVAVPPGMEFAEFDNL